MLLYIQQKNQKYYCLFAQYNKKIQILKLSLKLFISKHKSKNACAKFFFVLIMYFFCIAADTANCRVDIQAKTFGFWVPFSPPDNNVCHFLLNSYCPLDGGEVVVYNLRLPILKVYPVSI